jgi:hypothetical protein
MHLLLGLIINNPWIYEKISAFALMRHMYIQPITGTSP